MFISLQDIQEAFDATAGFCMAMITGIVDAKASQRGRDMAAFLNNWTRKYKWSHTNTTMWDALSVIITHLYSKKNAQIGAWYDTLHILCPATSNQNELEYMLTVDGEKFRAWICGDPENAYVPQMSFFEDLDAEFEKLFGETKIETASAAKLDELAKGTDPRDQEATPVIAQEQPAVTDGHKLQPCYECAKLTTLRHQGIPRCSGCLDAIGVRS